MEIIIDGQKWDVAGYPGYLGKHKDAQEEHWNKRFGANRWQLLWMTASGEIWDYPRVFWRIYVPGYTHFFQKQPTWARWISQNFAYTYDKDLIGRKEAFDLQALYGKPGVANQFYHVALNEALEYVLGFSFKAAIPLQVREGKTGTNKEEWPLGWRFSPGRIPTTRPDLIPPTTVKGWWREGSIEDFYQKAKVLLRKVGHE